MRRKTEPKTPPKDEPAEDLHVTVESAFELLPATGRDSCDSFVTVRADPLEVKHGRRTAIKHSTRDPVRGLVGDGGGRVPLGWPRSATRL